MYLLLPFFAALAFAYGSLAFKRAYLEGAGVAHAVIVNNVLLGVVFLPLLALDARPVPWRDAWIPGLTALAFVTGHLLNVASLKVGDVSLATPVLGAKVTFVVLLAWLVFGRPPALAQTFAAGLTTAGVLIMGLTDRRAGQRTLLTVGLALGCAAAFALTDVTIQAWAGGFGVWNFLALVFAALALLSLALLPCFGRDSLRAPRRAWNWILVAAAMSGLQALLITASIGFWKDAAAVNVIYATRGLLSIALVWLIGHRLRNVEKQQAGARVMLWRVVGASLILVAVALTLWAPGRTP